MFEKQDNLMHKAVITCDKCSTQGIPNEANFCPYCGYQLKPGYFEVVNFGINPDNKLFTVNGNSFKMIKVEGGTFRMGVHANQDLFPEDFDEEYDYMLATHPVTISSYYIAETEVTQELWESVMGYNPSSFKYPTYPVNASYDDCKEFIRKLNILTKMSFRLPTEAEWEFAARGGNKSKGYRYAGSDKLDDVGWCDCIIDDVGWRDIFYSAHPVKMKAPNELGLYDMSGNVWEWCNDYWYDEYPSAYQPIFNPQGPSSGFYRVRRGGSCWDCTGLECLSCFRDYRDPNYGGCDCGFRLALSEPQAKHLEL